LQTKLPDAAFTAASWTPVLEAGRRPQCLLERGAQWLCSL